MVQGLVKVTEDSEKDIHEQSVLQYAPRAQIVAFMSGKGGVGKTGLSINIAHFCACYGAKVLLIDGDLSTSGATTFFRLSNPSLNRESNILTIHNLFSAMLNKEKVGVDSEYIDSLQPFVIEKNFTFIPTVIGSKLIDERDLDDRSLEGVIKDFEQIVSEWRRQYEIIILDLGAGYNRINSFFKKIADNICVVMEENKISGEAVRSCLSILCREYDIEKIICCINKWVSNDAEETKDPVGIIFREVKGYPYNKKYADTFEKGRMLSMGDNKQTERMMRIVEGILIDSKMVLQNYGNEMFRLRKEEDEKQRKKRLKHIRITSVIDVTFLIILACMVTGLDMWGKIPVWGYVLTGILVAVTISISCGFWKFIVKIYNRYLK